MSIEKNIEKRVKALEEVVSYAKQVLSKSPEGSLLVKRVRGNERYYWRNQKADVLEKYLGSKDTDLVASLQEKLYYEQLLQAAQNELKALESCHKLVKNQVDFDSVFVRMPENKRNLIKPYISPEVDRVKKSIEKDRKMWKSDFDEDRKYVSRTTNLTTTNGERVRSKSELIIAERLRAAEIPYYYEGHHLLVDEETDEWDVWYPDFRVLNIKTGKMYFWEHFGMMDNTDYCASSQYKLETYAKHGIIMGKNLIVTMESSTHGLNTEYVDCMINTYLKH